MSDTTTPPVNRVVAALQKLYLFVKNGASENVVYGPGDQAVRDGLMANIVGALKSIGATTVDHVPELAMKATYGSIRECADRVYNAAWQIESILPNTVDPKEQEALIGVAGYVGRQLVGMGAQASEYAIGAPSKWLLRRNVDMAEAMVAVKKADEATILLNWVGGCITDDKGAFPKGSPIINDAANTMVDVALVHIENNDVEKAKVALEWAGGCLAAPDAAGVWKVVNEDAYKISERAAVVMTTVGRAYMEQKDMATAEGCLNWAAGACRVDSVAMTTFVENFRRNLSLAAMDLV